MPTAISQLPAATTADAADVPISQGGVTKRLAATLLRGATGPAGPQGIQGPAGPAGTGSGGAAPAGTYLPQTYGAVANGASRTAGAALGITTRAQLAAYVLNGATPYAWINTDLWKNFVNLDLSGAAASGATSLSFASTAGVTTGMRALGEALPGGATVTAVTATSVTLSAGLTAAKQAGMTVSFQSSLTDAQCVGLEMDGLAIQAAIQAAAGAGGGTVVLSPGTYLCDRTIILPVRSEASGQQVDVQGAGPYLSTLRAKSDFGLGQALFACGDPAAAKGHRAGRYGFNYYEGLCADFALEGPNRNAGAKGTAPAQMDGFAHGPRRTCKRIRSTFFRAAWSFVGDHSLISECIGQYSYYGAYFPDANPTLYGDYRFEYCFFMGNNFAGMAASRNSLISAMFLKLYIGGNPYHIVGEAGQGVDYGQPFGGSADTPILQGCTFYNPQFEWAGNGSIVDLNTDTGGGRRPLINTAFHGGYWSWDTNLAISGRGQKYYFDFGGLEGVSFYEVGNGSFEITAGQLGFMRINAVDYYGGGLKLQGAMRTVLNKYGIAGIPFFAEAFGRFSQGQWRNIVIENEGWIGRVNMIGGTAAVPAGTVMEAGGEFQGVQPCTGGTAPIVGIVVCAAPALGTAADRLIVLATGTGLRALWGTGTNVAGQWVKGAAGGRLQPATGRTDGQIVGWAWHANAGGTDSPTIQTLTGG